MPRMTTFLSAQRITQLRQSRLPIAIEVVDETASTNADLLVRVDHLLSPLLLIAEKQTAGRGRAGRVWHSEAGASLTFSLAWKFMRSAHQLAGLPLAVGVALTEALTALDVDAQLKWPNDILLDGRKLAGILIELRRSAVTGDTWAVIGIGINLALPPTLTEQLAHTAAAPDVPPARHQLMAAILDSLCERLALFETHGFAAFVEPWNQRHAYAGKSVVISDHGKLLHEGRAQGVDHNGRLLLDTAHGRIAIVAGDVSLRLAD